VSSTWKRACALAFVGAVGVGTAISAAGVATAVDIKPAAQLPGDDGSGKVVITDSDKVTVTVDSVDLATGNVTGTLTNTSGNAMNCRVPGANGENFNNVVTEASLVGLAFDYYRHNIAVPPGDLQNSTGNATVTIPLGSLFDYTGSFGQIISDTTDMRAMTDQARIAGHFGTIAPMTNVAPGATTAWTSRLSTPTSGVRSEFDAAALFYCTDRVTNKDYVFAADENGEIPGVPEGAGGAGSLASSGSGSAN